MYYYKVYGLIFESNIVMPQLLCMESQSKKDASILWGSVPAFIKEEKAKRAGGDNGDSIWFHNSKAYYWITDNEIIVEPKEKQELDDIVPFIQGYCFAMLFSKRGLHALHCSALYGENGVVLIGGYSGAGKSTITNKLLQEGYRLMADDVSVLQSLDDKIQVFPGFPIQKICPDVLIKQNIEYSNLEMTNEGKGKYVLDCRDNFYDKPAILYKFIILDKQIMPEINQVNITNGTDMLLSFIDNLFLSEAFPCIGFPPLQMQAAIDIVTKLECIYMIYRTEDIDSVDRVYGCIRKILNKKE